MGRARTRYENKNRSLNERCEFDWTIEDEIAETAEWLAAGNPVETVIESAKVEPYIATDDDLPEFFFKLT